MGKFVILNGNGKYRFNLKADNHQTILTSESYTSKGACENGIASVKTNVPLDGRYEKLNSSNSKFYFNLKAGDGEIINTSEMYESESDRDNGIESVKRNAPAATVEEE